MKVGTFIGGWLSHAAEEARQAEEIGHDYVASDESHHDSMLTMAIAAANTSRVPWPPGRHRGLYPASVLNPDWRGRRDSNPRPSAWELRPLRKFLKETSGSETRPASTPYSPTARTPHRVSPALERDRLIHIACPASRGT